MNPVLRIYRIVLIGLFGISELVSQVRTFGSHLKFRVMETIRMSATLLLILSVTSAWAFIMIFGLVAYRHYTTKHRH